MEKKFTFSIKDIIYIIVAISGWLWNIVDKKINDATLEVKIEKVLENDEKREGYWLNQNEINGRILIYMQLAPDRSGTQEEGDQEEGTP